jgi:GWxTD domain-containing protein
LIYSKRIARSNIIPIALFLIPFWATGNNYNSPLSLPETSETSPQYTLDINFYSGADSFTQLELYYSIPAKQLSFIDTAGYYLSAISFTLKVTDKNNNIVINKSKVKSIRVNTSEDTSSASLGIVDLLLFDLTPGSYLFETTLNDKNGDKKSSITGMISVPDYSTSLSISTLQFAALISTENTNKLFIKGNKTVIPNPPRKYKMNQSFLYTYFEIYNMKIDKKDNKAHVHTNIYILNNIADTVLALRAQSIALPGTSCLLTKTIDIRSLPEGQYSLVVKAEDLSSGEKTTQKSFFWIYNPLQSANQLPMSDEDIKRYRDQIKYFASKKELKVYDLLDKKGKEKFLIDFWHSRDKTPETPQNEFMQDCFARIDYANKHFKGKGSGLNSDMGRVFVIYGQPDEIDNHTMNLGGKPYIIWIYYTSGKGKQSFVFIDKDSNGIYTLVHSTVEREIYNPNWMNQELN